MGRFDLIEVAAWADLTICSYFREFENEDNHPELEPAVFKYTITQAIQSLHGEVRLS